MVLYDCMMHLNLSMENLKHRNRNIKDRSDGKIVKEGGQLTRKFEIVALSVPWCLADATD